MAMAQISLQPLQNHHAGSRAGTFVDRSVSGLPSLASKKASLEILSLLLKVCITQNYGFAASDRRVPLPPTSLEERTQ
jgi:hypothetical protein